jgi:tetratricopeptide (TPR) repeat protein
MESLSRKLDKNTGSYLARRRRKRLAALLSLIVAATLVVVIAIRLERSGAFAKIAAERPVAKGKVLEAWGARDWDLVRSETTASLASRPFDSFYLAFLGFASYYSGLDLPEGENRQALIDEAVVSLRKAIASGGRMPTAQVQYVLGKAYFQKGRQYYDEAAKYLELSLEAGYSAPDTNEYLALAYSGLGEKAKAVEDFEAALRGGRAAPLLIAAAKAYVDAGEPKKAEALLLEAVSPAVQDDVAVENGRFILGEIYRSRGDLARAEEQYSLALAKDPASAEAHYRLGLVAQAKGDPLRARAEWRKSVSIDPMHAAARQKLSEKQ